jgi:uncharacterized metal-binding protein
MPSGKVHDRITVIGAAVAAPTYYLLTPVPKDLAAGVTLVVAILFSGLFLSPDLDLNSSIYHRWGPLRFLWWPYQKLMPHRSYLSHSFIVGPLLRVAYFAVMMWGLFRFGTWIASFFITFDRNGISKRYADVVVGLWQTYPWDVEMAALGIFLGTALHCGADIVVSRLFHRRHRR